MVILDASDGTERSRFQASGDPIWGIAWSPDGARLAVADEGGVVPYHGDLPKILDKVYACSEIVEIDYFIPGCPPDANHIWKSLLGLLSGQPLSVTYSEFKYD